MKSNFCFIQTIKKVLEGRYTIIFVMIACIFFISTALIGDNEVRAVAINSLETGSNSEHSSSGADQADVSSIDAVIKTLYDTISFEKGGEPDLNRFRSLFTPNAPFIRISAEGPNTMGRESFIASFKERVKTGALKSFYEAEISRKTFTFGSIAQVFSTYNKGMNTRDPESMVHGINSIQLYHDGQRWWVNSILWEDERSDNPIPQKYLR